MKRDIESGIYEIVNATNGHRYVGSAVRPLSRWIDHRKTLRRETHHSRYLQAAWIKYGEESFLFRLVLVCERSNLLLYEQIAIDAMHPEYNILKIAGSCLGRKATQETKAKLSAAKKGRKLSPEHIAKLAALSRGRKMPPRTPDQRLRYAAGSAGNSNSLGKPKSEETKRKLSITSTGNKNALGAVRSPETRVKIALGHIGKGLPKSPSHRDNNAVVRGGLTMKQAGEIRSLYASGMRNQSAIARMYGLKPCSVSRLISGETYSYLGVTT